MRGNEIIEVHCIDCIYKLSSFGGFLGASKADAKYILNDDAFDLTSMRCYCMPIDSRLPDNIGFYRKKMCEGLLS